MKVAIKILASILLLNNVEAATLSCADYYANSVNGISANSSNAVTVGEYKRKGTIADRHINSAKATLILTNQQSHVLDGAWIVIAHQLCEQCYSNYYPVAQIKKNTTTYNSVKFEFPGTGYTSITRLLLSGASDAETSVKLDKTIPLHVDTVPFIEFILTDKRTLGSDVVISVEPLNVSFQRDLLTTDVITFPDTINLGNIHSGLNTSDSLIKYEVNTNSLGIKFSENTTNGASLTVNDVSLIPNTTYKPPLKFGLNVYSDTPGIYTSSVSASWTCP
ncbi:hypothetical protein M7963_08075 [Enterobacter roggenkampii]|uniref:hypothetical protein n=1 Tax=Enterobacter roggenkampii TaxID=1812935 RepID=UPI0022391293|nr:hypothetical protein [Enterobacter roggenkampii]MCW5001474.1 hypothetical protein [Enterobacter roggenkampii]